jgi:hypothetical protein
MSFIKAQTQIQHKFLSYQINLGAIKYKWKKNMIKKKFSFMRTKFSSHR